jgi:hypothetical protein
MLRRLGVVALIAPVVALASAEPALAIPSAVTFNSIGRQQVYVVPAAVSAVQINAAGASGWDEDVADDPGYNVTGDVTVGPGETLYVEVGSNGAASGASFGGGGLGGAGSGGAGSTGGSGGGASDVRTCSELVASCPGGGTSLGSRLIIGAGGGGSGGVLDSHDFVEAGGGSDCTAAGVERCVTVTTAAGVVVDGGEASANSAPVPVTPAKGGFTSGGAGGAIANGPYENVMGETCFLIDSNAGAPGSLGVGGTGAIGTGVDGGGGGGGGYYGGGGGGGGRVPSGTGCPSPLTGDGSGGGTGSSFLAAGVVNPDYEPTGSGAGPENTSLVTITPLIELDTPTNGATYAHGQVVKAAYSCNTAAGPYCQGTPNVASGSPIDTSTPGRHTFTVKNGAPNGEPSEGSVTTTVTYTVTGGKATALHLAIKKLHAKGRKLAVSGTLAPGFNGKLTIAIVVKHGRATKTLHGHANAAHGRFSFSLTLPKGDAVKTLTVSYAGGRGFAATSVSRR